MNKFLKNIMVGTIIAGMVFPSAVCGFDIETANVKDYTVAELKNEFGSSELKYMFKPFYNVEQNTKFAFNFNSEVDPVKAVTVHTDAKCEEASTVYQINDGYRTENGVAVVVKPRNAVLGSDDRNDPQKGVWGYAPIYYLSVNYDLDSTEVVKLDEPIIIPFTIRHKVSTPNAYADIDNTGTFSVKWLPVENAVAYKVYRGRSLETSEYTSAEIAYSQSSFKLIETVDDSTFQYRPKYEDYEVKDGVVYDVFNDDNLYIRDGKVNWQNANHGNNYFVTAVDKDGNESAFSKNVSDKKYGEVLPYRTKDYFGGTKKEFLNTIEVLSCDEKTIVNYPINYYKNEDPSEYYLHCEYRYEIVGTRLNGKITYYNENREFPEKVISSHERQTITVDEVPNSEIPDINVESIIDEDYKNSIIDLSTEINYPPKAKIQLDPASLIRRVDLELVRLLNETGSYSESLDTIETYVLTDNPEYIYSNENGVITVRKATEEDKKKVTDEVLLSKKSSLETAPSKIIDNSNYVEEQRKSTKKQVEEANKEVVKGTNYPIFANTAGQKYIALSLINQEKEISLKAFPEYQDFATFIDDLYYVWYQNPYIMGLDPSKLIYSTRGQKATVEYNLPDDIAKKQQNELYKRANEVIAEIIKEGMTNQEKVVAIWNYLEKNAGYNYEAANYVYQGAMDYYKKYPNAWNSYGVLCENKGVCQSYSHTFNLLARLSGLDTVMVSGTMNNGGHAWNSVKVNDKWYMLDVTNNSNASGIPYWICNSSTKFITSNGFVLNDKFVDGTDLTVFKTNDSNADWYYINNSLAKTPRECAEIWVNNKNSTSYMIIKYESDIGAIDFINATKAELINMGYSDDEVNCWRYIHVDGMLIIKK